MWNFEFSKFKKYSRLSIICVLALSSISRLVYFAVSIAPCSSVQRMVCCVFLCDRAFTIVSLHFKIRCSSSCRFWQILNLVPPHLLFLYFFFGPSRTCTAAMSVHSFTFNNLGAFNLTETFLICLEELATFYNLKNSFSLLLGSSQFKRNLRLAFTITDLFLPQYKIFEVNFADCHCISLTAIQDSKLNANSSFNIGAFQEPGRKERYLRI